MNRVLSSLFLLSLYVDFTYGCNCDFIGGYCNINCCCDADCLEGTKSLFETCDFEPQKLKLLTTLNLFRNPFDFCTFQRMSTNPSEKQADVFRLTAGCIYSNNNQNLSFTSYNSTVLTVGDPLPSAIYLRQTSDAYKIGQPLAVTFNQEENVTLNIPFEAFGGVCEELKSASFLTPIKSRCRIRVTKAATFIQDIETVPCNRLSGVPGLSPDAGPIGNFSVYSQPPISSNQYRTKLIKPKVSCIGKSDGRTVSCPITAPSDSSNLTAVCKNVPISIRYEFYYTPEGLIAALNITAAIDDVPQWFIQETEVKFTQVNATFAVPHSGNPGYLIGMPVVGARANRTVLSDLGQVGSTGIVTTMIPTSKVVQLNGVGVQTTGGIWKVPAGGSCLNSSISQKPLNFAEDVLSGCILDFSSQELQEITGDSFDGQPSCTLYQNLIWRILNGSYSGHTESEEFGDLQPDHLAVWPAALTNRSGDWVPILRLSQSSGPSQPVAIADSCNGLLVGQETVIQYAKFGSLVNPQYRIVGVTSNYVYGNVNIKPQKQKLEITYRVQFVDVSKPLQYMQKERPLLVLELPSDFFYPFV